MYIKLKRMAIVVILFTTISCNSGNPSESNIIYDGNGNTSGDVPTDATLYNHLQSVTVLDNTGNLRKTNYAFAGWSKKASGEGKTYTAGETFLMGTSDVTLYAAWDDGNQCVFNNCSPEISECLQDEECSKWISCITECGDDKFKCPTFCGLYYQSPNTEQITICALGNECPVIDFSDFGTCDVPEAEFLDLGNMSGTWWLSASSGEDHVFDFDCQQFVFEEQDPTLLNVNYTVTVDKDGDEKWAIIDGIYGTAFTPPLLRSSGAIALHPRRRNVFAVSSVLRNSLDFDIDIYDHSTLVQRIECTGMVMVECWSPKGDAIVIREFHSALSSSCFIVYLQEPGVRHRSRGI